MKLYDYFPSILYATILFAASFSEKSWGVPFQNLDFEQGFTEQVTPSVIPGWHSTLPPADSICFCPGCGILVGPHWPTLESSVLSGTYSVELNAASYGIEGGAAYILQSGTIPANAKSLRILVGDWSSQEFGTQSETKPFSAAQALRITINDQQISMTEIEDLGNGIGIIGGDIVQFAGQDVELRISATTENIPGLPQFPYDTPIVAAATVGGLIDDIAFSPIAAVPEPHTLVLLGLFGAMLSYRRPAGVL